MKCNKVIILTATIFNALLISVSGKWSSNKQWIDEKNTGIINKDFGKTINPFLFTEKCFGRQCFESNQCCKGFACVTMKETTSIGTCLPIFSRIEGDPCTEDEDCANFLRCLGTENSKTCQKESKDVKKKLFNNDCLTSAECDIDRKLCCQIQRRHRMAPRRVCYYFFDPKSCIGSIPTAYINPIDFLPNPFFKARLG